ncbi:MAG: hypothetical protein JST00_44575 [Deltaproteobacteria bacterium]|nr:hypothetical protein [Deltaproteobacteria bacterium]
MANRALARAIERAARERLVAAIAQNDALAARADDVPIVALRTRKRLAALGPTGLEGAIAVMRVTAKGARRLPALVESVRANGVAGVQIVWDGATPPREEVEPYVFAILERARATPKDPPVVLARTEEPARALRILVSRRREP